MKAYTIAATILASSIVAAHSWDATIPDGLVSVQGTYITSPLSPDTVFIGEKTYPIGNWLQVPNKEVCEQLLELNKSTNRNLECIVKIGDNK